MLFTLTADHFQFFFGDRLLGPTADTTHLWDGAGMVAMMNGLVGVTTVRYGGDTRVSLRIIPAWGFGTTEGRLLGEAVLEVPSGKVVFWAPETSDIDACPTFSIDAGTYDVIVNSRGTEGIVDEMDTDGPDEYEVVLRERP